MVRRFVAGMVGCLLLIGGASLRAEDRFFDSGGVKIRYIDQGKGEPVVLIHGFGANLDVQWVLPGVVKALAQDYRVIAYDNRGHGRSGKPHDPRQYGMELVEDPVRLLDHLGIRKAHVVGYSMGAMITAKLLVTHPERLRTATLGGAGPAHKDQQAERFYQQLADSLEQGKGVSLLLEHLTPAGRPKPSAAQLQTINQTFSAFNDTKALAAVVRSWKELAVSEEQLKANRVPTLALVGAIDPLRKGVDELEGRLADLKVVVIPGADHMTAFVRPLFINTLKDFLAQHAAGGKARKRTAAPTGSSR